MAFQPQKCKVLHVTGTRSPVYHIYHIRETELESVSHAAYLDTELVEKLTWTKHINQTCNCKGNSNSMADMLTDLKWETLQKRRAKFRVVMMYKIVHCLVAIPITPHLHEYKGPHLCGTACQLVLSKRVALTCSKHAWRNMPCPHPPRKHTHANLNLTQLTDLTTIVLYILVYYLFSYHAYLTKHVPLCKY